MNNDWNKLMAVMAGVCAAAGLLSGCTSSPAKETVYIPPEYAVLMKLNEDGAFQKAWGKPEEIRKYDKINIAVVISPRQLEESWWASNNIRNLVSSKEEDMKYVAEYTRDSFIKAFSKSKHYQLTANPAPNTLALEFAIVQMVPNKPVLGAVSNLSSLTPIGLMMLPLKMGGKSASDNTGGAVAIESVVRDSQTGAVLAVFADREKGKTALFNVKEFTAYANIREIIDKWTANVVTALDQIKEGKKVKLDEKSGFAPIDY